MTIITRHDPRFRLSEGSAASGTTNDMAKSMTQNGTNAAKNGGSKPSAESADVIFVAVRDQGAGIPPEEQARVFTRLYRADNPLIQGLGDTGVGLSIARALTEVHGGRIWLESVPGTGSTFKLILPLQHALAAEALPYATP